ncbi:uncharacterized protein LOC128891351 isoform X1 [Hylaeus anthracinus]|uniref:uncharacterized protein LOC128891351 isoform X1 n=1 Tax=Hylaeus anthracinus TaxID=313031 RepID=UPI0023B8DD2B|nr:uncharacterized protein LOC128891351 isoform X1 [Hylaeus anthracinus]XP_054006764.1 uncharacterized protein LOC128891351 isoform X1 [Hylaeus anthracinus]
MTGWRMQPHVSALGVIAIVFVMITITASEAENGAIENSINHPRVDEKDRRLEEDERLAGNGTVDRDSIVPTLQNRFNETGSEITVSGDEDGDGDGDGDEDEHSPRDTENRDDPTNVSVSESLATPVALNGIHDSQSVHGPTGTEQKIFERNSLENQSQVIGIDYGTSAQPSRVESTSTTLWVEHSLLPKRNNDLDAVRVNDKSLSNVVDVQVDGSGLENDESVGSTSISILPTIVTMTSSTQQKNAEDIRAISFQVPSPVLESDERHQRRGGNEESRKDYSKMLNNHFLPSGKFTKGFYEIKPSIKTEIENDRDRGRNGMLPTTTQRILLARKFLVPTVDSAFGKFGPYYEDGGQEVNVSARIGSTMLLDCRVGMLGNKEVVWLQQHSNDSFRLLTVGKTTYSVDQRISLEFRYPSNYRLQIQYATPRDSGLYKCQVSTHPPLVKNINVIVTAPELTITDDSGRIVPKERHLKAGSALKLKCEARDVLEVLKESVIWTRGDETLTEDVSENRTTEITAGKEVLVIVSTLIVEKATPRHAGNYTCVVPGKANTTIAVHVLNGELPAAVHDGNGVSKAFLNLWLIHLTMSYVFSR